MLEFLKAAAAIVIIWALSGYAVRKVVGKAIDLSAESAEGFKLECKPLEFPDVNFDWNANWSGGAGLSGYPVQERDDANVPAKQKTTSRVDYGETRYSPPRRPATR